MLVFERSTFSGTAQKAADITKGPAWGDKSVATQNDLFLTQAGQDEDGGLMHDTSCWSGLASTGG